MGLEVGGAFWALDVANGDLHALPAFGRGAWENATEVDTGTETHVAFMLTDDTAPFDADGDGISEGAPLYLYVGEKSADPAAGFLARNGLAGGDLYVWVSGDPAKSDPETYRIGDAALAGQWVSIDTTPDPALADEFGANGFDGYGYPTQRTLWTRAEEAGAFRFARPEDIATNPADGAKVISPLLGGRTSSAAWTGPAKSTRCSSTSAIWSAAGSAARSTCSTMGIPIRGNCCARRTISTGRTTASSMCRRIPRRPGSSAKGRSIPHRPALSRSTRPAVRLTASSRSHAMR